MNPPLLSTLTLIAELLIFGVILYVFYKGYMGRVFPYRLAYFAIVYEVVFNVGYMIYRTIGLKSTDNLSAGLKILGVVHGILSLIVFIAMLIFIAMAIKNYKRGINYFRDHPLFSAAIIFLWIISLASGLLLYFRIYF